MLEKLIGYHPIAVKTIAQASRNSFLSSNDGITACCKRETTKLVQMLIDHDPSLSPRILWLSVSHANYDAAKLIFDKYKHALTVECCEFTTHKHDTTQRQAHHLVSFSFHEAASNRNTAMLELFIDEIGTDLTRKLKAKTFLTSCIRNDHKSIEMFLTRCPSDLQFESGSEPKNARLFKLKDATWDLLVKTYGDRMCKTDREWMIDPIQE